MLKLLKSYHPANLLLIILITIILSVKFFVDTDNTSIYSHTETYLIYNQVFNFFNNLAYPVINKTIALIFILFEAFFFTLISNHYNLLGKRSYLPMLIFLLIILNTINSLEISPILFANTLFLIAWMIIKKAKSKDTVLSNYFNASFLIGIASLFYFNYIYLIFVLWINLIIIRGARIREMILSVLGATMVWYFVFSYYYFNNTTFPDYSHIFTIDITGLNILSTIDLSEKIIRFYIIALFTLSVLSLFKYFNYLKIDIRNNFKFLFVLFVFGILLFALSASSFEVVHLIAIPVSLFISNFLISAKKQFWSNILFSGLILITIFNIYLSFLLNKI